MEKIDNNMNAVLESNKRKFEYTKKAILERLHHFTDTYKNLTDHVGTSDDFTPNEKKNLNQFFESFLSILERNHEYLDPVDSEHIEIQCKQCQNYLSKNSKPTDITPKSPHDLKVNAYRIFDYVEKLEFKKPY